MPDIAEKQWTESDDKNVEQQPNGFPGGMPAYIDGVGRMLMGAIKRSWRRFNPYYLTTGTGDDYVVSPDQSPTKLNLYEILNFRIDRANTTATPTLRFGRANPFTIVKIVSGAKVGLGIGDLVEGKDHAFWFDGVNFVLSNPGAFSSFSPSDFATAAQGGKADSALQPSDVGTTAGTVAAGDDSRIVGALQPDVVGFVTPYQFGGVGDGTAIDTDALKAAFAEAQATKRAVYLGGKGVVWRVKDGQWPGYSGDEMRTVILIDGWDAVVYGDGATILFDGDNVNEYATVFRSANGGTLRRRGVNLDWIKPPFTQGFCVSKTATSATFLLDVAACGLPSWANTGGTVQSFQGVERVKSFVYVPEAGYYTHNQTVTEQGTGRRPIKSTATPGQYEVDYTGFTAELANINVGELYVLYHKVNGYYFSSMDDGSIWSENCWTYCSAGMADVGSRMGSYSIIGGGIAPSNGRQIATTSDGYHVNGCREFYVNVDLIDGTSDDAVNLNVPCSNVNNASPGAPYNDGKTFLIAFVPPAGPIVVGDVMYGIGVDSSQSRLGVVTAVSTASPASSTNPAITLDTNLPVGFSATWKVFPEKYCPVTPVYTPTVVRRVAGSASNIKGRSAVIRGSFVDISGPAYTIVCFWPIFNEGPVSSDLNVDIETTRCGRHRDAVTGVLRVDQVRVDTGQPAPAVIKNGRVRVKGADCRPGLIWATSCENVVFDVEETNTGFDQWASVPQPTAVGYFQNTKDCVISWKHAGNSAKLIFFQDGNNNRLPPANQLVTYGGTGFRALAQSLILSEGGNSIGAGGKLQFLTNAAAIGDTPMAEISGSLANAAAGEQQGSISFKTRNVGSAGQALTERLKVLYAGPLNFTPFTVAQLPAVTNLQGSMAYVSDATSTTRGSTVAGGGSNGVFVMCNGTNWLVM